LKTGIRINHLQSGGLITNYYCASKCGHCLYACSPQWKKDYISRENAEKSFRLIKNMGCPSVHIGGGEPFLNFNGLKTVLEAAQKTNMGIEYIETNSAWYKNEDQASGILDDLLKLNVTTLLISISPFHNEFIPFRKVKGVLSACRKSGMQVFPWVMDFYSDLDQLDDNLPHPMNDYKELFGEDYLTQIPRRYWTIFGGRAINTFKDALPLRPLEQVLAESSECYELTNTSHFHIDLYGNYIPGLCSGLAINMFDLLNSLSDKKYPLINLLFSTGIKSFLDLAIDHYGFTPDQAYLNKCHLCQEIRKYFVNTSHIQSNELKPAEFYSML